MPEQLAILVNPAAAGAVKSQNSDSAEIADEQNPSDFSLLLQGGFSLVDAGEGAPGALTAEALMSEVLPPEALDSIEAKALLNEEELQQLITDLSDVLTDADNPLLAGESLGGGMGLPLEGQALSLEELMLKVEALSDDQLNKVTTQLPAVSNYLNRLEGSYFSKLNTQETSFIADIDASKITQDLMDSGLGNKAQYHDRLINTVVAMRYELATDRRVIDTQQLLSDEVDLDVDAPSVHAGLISPQTNTSTTPPTVSNINIPVGNSRWGAAVSEKIVWMANNQIKEAEIKLTPANLGSIDIKLSIKDDQVTVVFNVQTTESKEALDSTLPRLREMLAEAGFHLSDSEVTDHSSQQQDKHSESQVTSDSTENDELENAEISNNGVAYVSTQSGLDLYI